MKRKGFLISEESEFERNKYTKLKEIKQFSYYLALRNLESSISSKGIERRFFQRIAGCDLEFNP